MVDLLAMLLVIFKVGDPEIELVVKGVNLMAVWKIAQ
jgi:hypothetical protein